MIDTAWQKMVGSIDVPSAGACETVNIVSADAPGGLVVINQSDYDPETMKLYTEKK